MFLLYLGQVFLLHLAIPILNPQMNSFLENVNFMRPGYFLLFTAVSLAPTTMLGT